MKGVSSFRTPCGAGWSSLLAALWPTFSLYLIFFSFLPWQKLILRAIPNKFSHACLGLRADFLRNPVYTTLQHTPCRKPFCQGVQFMWASWSFPHSAWRLTGELRHLNRGGKQHKPHHTNQPFSFIMCRYNYENQQIFKIKQSYECQTQGTAEQLSIEETGGDSEAIFQSI